MVFPWSPAAEMVALPLGFSCLMLAARVSSLILTSGVFRALGFLVRGAPTAPLRKNCATPCDCTPFRTMPNLSCIARCVGASSPSMTAAICEYSWLLPEQGSTNATHQEFAAHPLCLLPRQARRAALPVECQPKFVSAI